MRFDAPQALCYDVGIMAQLPLKIGVVGVGRVGTLHAQIYARLPEVTVAHVCDVDAERAAQVAGETGAAPCTNFRRLFGQVDAVSLAVPTTAHYAIARAFLKRGMHLLVEKPLATSLRQADALVALAEGHRAVLHVGHVERFNPAIRAMQPLLTRPRFVECHRLSPYPHRSTDISVVMDVMIHDLDIIATWITAPLKRVDAVGLRVLSSSEDIANARLEFADGAICDVTASRVSPEVMRKIRLFLDDAYCSIDYKQQTVELYRKADGQIVKEPLPTDGVQPLEAELAAFVASVRQHQAGGVSTAQRPASGIEGRRAIELALLIERKIRARAKRWNTSAPT